MSELSALADKRFRLDAASLTGLARDARKRTLALVEDLGDDRWQVQRLETVNPTGWELGHIAYFYEVFVLRELDQSSPFIPGADRMFDSFKVAHEARFDMELPTRREILAYMHRVLDAITDRLASSEPTATETYLHLLATLHEDMHGEALTYTRQTLEDPEPLLAGAEPSDTLRGAHPGDVEIPGGRFLLGATESASFVFDNEKWAHPVSIPPFRIARAPVTNGEFREFVENGGYRNERWWSYQGWCWRSQAEAAHPIYWRKEGTDWVTRLFDRLWPLAEHQPVVHVSWYEAEAYCRWAGRRLPTEAEWEMAASAAPDSSPEEKRIYPWGDDEANANRANLDARLPGTVDVAAFPEGDSAFGCRQMLGNVWEWTSSAFYPYPGYLLDYPYREYSAPWFGYQKVLKGGAWSTRSRLVHNTYRNFFLPHRRDIFAGFRTCAEPGD